MAGIQFTSASQPVSDKILNGGLNSTAGPFGLKEHESSDLQNVDFDKFGSLLKRNGYAGLNTASIAACQSDGLYWYEFDNSGTYASYALNVTSSKISKMDALDGTWDDISGVVSITSGNHCDFDTFNKKVFVTNGINAPFLWAGAGTARDSVVPTGLTSAKFVKQFNNYLFYANVVVSSGYYPTRIYWSALRDDTSWDTADWIEVAKDDGQEITGLKVLSDRLVIFKTRSIYNLYFTGDSDIPFILPGGGKSNSPVGCIAPFSIQEVENGLVFLSYDGLYYYDGMNSTKLSNNITNTLFGTNGYNSTYYSKAYSLVHKSKNRYWLTFTSSGETKHNRVVLWDYYNNAFSIYTGLAPSALATFYVSKVDERPYFCDYKGYTYRADNGTNDSPLWVATAIDSYYYTNWKAYDDLCDQKGIPHIYIYFQNSNAVLTFAYSYDFESKDQYTQTFSTATGISVYGTAVYGTGIYAGAGGGVERRDLIGRGRVVRFKFANSTLGETFRIDGFGTLPHLETNV